MKLFRSSSCEIVPRHQLPVLFVRGVAGIGLMAYAFTLLVSSPLLGWSLLGVSILLLKGCPACWGMHMVNAARDLSRGKRKVPAAQPAPEPPPKRRPYRPKDMAEHLFPPEDVARFRGMPPPEP